MNDRILQASRDDETLVRTIQFSMPIRRRAQFFVWSQGILQALLPHEALFCAYGPPGASTCIRDQYTATPFQESAYREICSPAHGVLVMMHAEWERSGNAPLLLSQERCPGRLMSRLAVMLKRHDLGNCAAHGIPALSGGAGSFFLFARMPDPIGPRHAALLDLILPYLHVAYLRTLMTSPVATGRAAGDPALRSYAALPNPLTARQIQILQWMHEGKSNREIADILNLSAFTVKNHVQNILRKLEVKNRTQAVSFALEARLIKSRPTSGVGG